MFDYKEKISLKGKNIIVTGACGLLGREFCKGIAQLNGNVIIADINAKAAEELAFKIKNEFSVNTLPVELDIHSEDSVVKALDTVRADLGEIHGLVNSAYPRNKSYGAKFENISFESWRENVDLHLNGYFNMTQKTSKVMMEQGFGNIINIGSIYGILGPDFSIYQGTSMTMPAEYSAIKGGIINFTRYLATYLAKYNIRVNSVTPGGIFDHQPQEFVESYSKKTPMGRMGNPDEIVGGVLFLLSELSSYITGHNLVIDGGWSIW